MIKHLFLSIFLFLVGSYTTNSEANNLKKFSINFIEKKSSAEEFRHMKKI